MHRSRNAELDVINGGYSSAVKLGQELDGQLEMPAIRTFCKAEAVPPADIAAEAIVVRWAPVLDEAFEGGIKIFEGNPPYVNIAMRELSVSQDELQFIG